MGGVGRDEFSGVIRDQNMKGLASHYENFDFCTE